MIETKVTLKSGKRVKAYYLDEAYKKHFEQLLYTKNEILSLNLNIKNIKRKLDLLFCVLKEEIKHFIRKKLIKEKSVYKEKSFRQYEFLGSLETIIRYESLVYSVFHDLVKENIIEYRGSGWYRFREIIKNEA